MKHLKTLSVIALMITSVSGIAQNTVSSPYLDVQGPLYLRGNVNTLNNAGTGWVTWATRNTSTPETTLDLMNLNSASFTSYISIGGGNPGGKKLFVQAGAPSDHIAVLENTSASGYGLVLNAQNDPLRVGPAGSSDGRYFIVGTGGNIGVGVTSPSAKFHVAGAPAALNVGNSALISSNLVIQSNSIGRATNAGAGLEFVIPANTDGTNMWGRTNMWGQGRIITVAGNTTNFNATGKMIFGTRRMFDKLANGSAEWFYGDDLTIDGSGNVGIGTTTPDKKLSVKGTIHTNEVLVDVNVQGPDYVFEKDYNLLPLSEVEHYIKQNKHLPEVPSAAEMEKDGLNLKEMNLILLKKVEELTLHVIEQKKEIEALRNEVTHPKNRKR